MKIYKITFNFYSPCSFFELPVFDSIVGYCLYANQQSVIDKHTSTGEEVRNSKLDTNIPLEKHELGFYLASYMCFPGKIEGLDSWKKRWENNHDRIVNFGKSKRRITTGMGQTKSYNMPMQINCIKKGWFYFASNDIEKVKKLIFNNLPGIGKKVAMGFGWIREIEIEESKNEDMLYYRPLPKTALNLALSKFGKLRQSFGSYKIPYWLPENQEKIIIPVLMEL